MNMKNDEKKLYSCAVFMLLEYSDKKKDCHFLWLTGILRTEHMILCCKTKNVTRLVLREKMRAK